MEQQIIGDINQTIFRYLENYPILQQELSLQEMLYYALGFRNDGSLLSGGKRLRPLFCCLTCGIVSGYYEPALLYGASLEMLHNFTLVHDDIEDNSDTRHNRPALWKKYGEALALNAGDMLYEIALSASANADKKYGKSGLSKVMEMSEYLFLGQHRDISFENRTDIERTEYIQMVRGKTSALLGCSFALGAMAGGADENTITEFEYIGQRIGIAFQIRDDYLGTWGDSGSLGKSVSSDIMDKKNTLAVIYTAQKDPEFKSKWLSYDGNADQVSEFADLMEKAGAPEFLDEQCQRYTGEAKEVLARHHVDNEFQKMMDELIASLIDRIK